MHPEDPPQLSWIAAEPGRIGDLPVEAIPGLIGAAEALKARLWAKLQTAPSPTGPSRPSGGDQPDRLLTVDEVAQILAVKRRWIYRHAASLPFTRRLTGGTLRFSERGLQRWQESKR